jgi:hypothetical protein
MKKVLILILFAGLFASCRKDANGGSSNNSASGGSTSGNAGQGGSLARFTIAQDHLFMVNDRELKTFSLANPADPVLTKSITIGEDIETIFSYRDKLFIGSRNAMYIYSIANPSSPQELGQASHVRACDPVVANDSIAYVTVRRGTDCGGTTNALYVYDVTNILNPKQKNVIALDGPWGLGMMNNRLYVCDGGNGLIVYNITNPLYPSQIKRVSGEIFYDVIPVDSENILICMIEGGIAIYSTANDELQKLAKIVN